MLDSNRVVAVVPARGGSKTVERKNVRSLAGKPLIGWSIEVAKQTKEIDQVIVSTDDEEIADVGRRYGAEVRRRPDHLATDTSLVIDALRDLLVTLREHGEDAQIMVLLEPTCPLRAVEDVERCVRLLTKRTHDSAATFKEADLNPHRAWRMEDGRPEVFVPGAVPWLPRQKLPVAYQLNGAVYAFYTDLLQRGEPSLLSGKTGAIVMPKERSIDIDDEIDFVLAEFLIRRQENEQKHLSTTLIKGQDSSY